MNSFKIRVLKFGGSSVKDSEAIESCAKLVKKQTDQNYKVCVVVSAMGTQTNQLLELAYNLSDSPSQRELDMLLSTGERVSCALLAIALIKKGLKAISLTGSQSGILTDGVHQNAKLSDIKCDRILESFRLYDVIVIAGFQGVNPETKEITTLGRGGSDLTAVALGVKLKAKDCMIYTDVDGILTGDPRLCSEAKTVPKVSWEQAYCLSCKGAQVLHYRASYLALKNQLPLIVLNSKDPMSNGTRVEGHIMENQVTKFISYKKNQTFLKIQGSHKETQTLYEDLLAWLWKKDELPSLARLESLGSEKIQMSLLIRNDLLSGLKSYLNEMNPSLKFFVEQDDVLVLFMIGQGYSHNLDFIKKAKSLLKKTLVFFDSNESFITLGLKTDIPNETINLFHNYFLK